MKLLTALAIIAMFLFTSCSSNNFTREKAQKIIEAEKMYPSIFDYSIFCNDVPEAFKAVDAGLERDGYVNVIKTKKFNEAGKPWITFTDKATPYLLPTPEKDKPFQIQLVKIADEEFVEITGLRLGQAKKTAMVEYTTVYKNISPFVVFLKKELKEKNNRKAYFALYDDGWRIVKKPGPEFIEFGG
ncbi:MAG: hypothetical protein DI535_26175 [Citrobacter freundii]|nr:MAG: hypothetical protein DI535_26175 [Citrobacter freundii]